MPRIFISFGLNSILEAITPYVGIFIAAQLINEIAGARNPDRLRFYAIAALVSAVILATLGALASRWTNYELAGNWYKTNAIYSDKLRSINFAAMEDSKTHDLLAHIKQSQNWQSWGLLRLIWAYRDFVRSTFGILGAVTLTISLFTLPVSEGAGAITVLNHPLLVLAIIAAMLVTTVVAPLLGNKSQSYWQKVDGKFGNRMYGAFGWFAQQDKNRAMDIRIYRQDIITTHYNRNNGSSTFGANGPLAKFAKGPMGALAASSAAVGHVFTGIIYVFVCLKAWGGAFGVGSVTQYIGAVSALSGNVSGLIRVLGTYYNNATYLQSLFEFLEIPNNMYQGSLTTEKRSDNKYEIEFRNVSFRYPGSEDYAVKNLSLSFNVGERLAVVGQNGSGKTTFIKLLCRLYDPTEGEILLNGIDIKKYNYQQYMDIFSAVFQDFSLLSFSIGQNVAASDEFDEAKALDCLTRAGFGERLASLENGLHTYLYKDIDKDGVDVSGGEAQKIAMARALYREAPFIILDEPTAALDPVAEFEIYSKMNEIVGNKTAVFISHRLSSCRFCQDIAVFHEGQLVQRGSHDALVAANGGKYHELWHAQAQYYNGPVL